MNKKINKWNKSLERAIIEEDTSILDEAFQKMDTVKNSRNVEGYSLLHFAVENSTVRMVKYFLDKGMCIKNNL